MKLIYIIILLLFSIFIFGFEKPDFQFTEYSKDDYEYHYSGDWYKDIITEPVFGNINSFDINNEGILLIGIEDNNSNGYILLYNHEGIFIKGFLLNHYPGSPFKVAFIDKTIGIIYTKEALIEIMDTEGNKMTVKELYNTYDVYQYLSSKNPKEMNGYKFYADKKPGPFPVNLFTYPTRMIIEDPDGNKNIISDNYIESHLKITAFTIFILYCCTGIFLVMLNYFYQLSKNENSDKHQE